MQASGHVSNVASCLYKAGLKKGVLSDWCCVYCFAGSAAVSVDGEAFTVNQGEMHIYSLAW